MYYFFLALPCIFVVLLSGMAISVVATRKVADQLDLSERTKEEATFRGGAFALLISLILGISWGGTVPYLEVPTLVFTCIANAVLIGVSYPVLLLLAVGLCRLGAGVDRFLRNGFDLSISSSEHRLRD